MQGFGKYRFGIILVISLDIFTLVAIGVFALVGWARVSLSHAIALVAGATFLGGGAVTAAYVLSPEEELAQRRETPSSPVSIPPNLADESDERSLDLAAPVADENEQYLKQVEQYMRVMGSRHHPLVSALLMRQAAGETIPPEELASVAHLIEAENIHFVGPQKPPSDEDDLSLPIPDADTAWRTSAPQEPVAPRPSDDPWGDESHVSKGAPVAVVHPPQRQEPEEEVPGHLDLF